MTTLAHGVYVHDTVSLVENLVNSNVDEIHTQNVAAMWARVKCKFKHQRANQVQLLLV